MWHINVPHAHSRNVILHKISSYHSQNHVDSYFMLSKEKYILLHTNTSFHTSTKSAVGISFIAMKRCVCWKRRGMAVDDLTILRSKVQIFLQDLQGRLSPYFLHLLVPNQSTPNQWCTLFCCSIRAINIDFSNNYTFSRHAFHTLWNRIASSWLFGPLIPSFHQNQFATRQPNNSFQFEMQIIVQYQPFKSIYVKCHSLQILFSMKLSIYLLPRIFLTEFDYICINSNIIPKS